MFSLTRWTQPRHITRLHEDMDTLFDRFFGRDDDLMPSRVMRSLRGFQRDLDNLFGGFFGPDWWAAAAEAGASWPRFESAIEDSEYVLRAEVPGLAPEHLEVNVAENTLTVRGERKTGGEEQGQTSYRRFSRSFTLPEGVDAEKVKAKLANGILEIRMPAPPKLAGKRIPIEIGAGEGKKELKAA